MIIFGGTTFTSMKCLLGFVLLSIMCVKMRANNFKSDPEITKMRKQFMASVAEEL